MFRVFCSQINFYPSICTFPVIKIFPATLPPRSTLSGKKNFLLYSQMPLIQIQLVCHPCIAITFLPTSLLPFSLINAFSIESQMSKYVPYLNQLVLSSPNLWGSVWCNLCPFRYIKLDKYPFFTIAFLSSSVIPQCWTLNEFNFTWHYVF